MRPLSRRRLLQGAAGTLVLGLAGGPRAWGQAAAGPSITVHKEPT